MSEVMRGGLGFDGMTIGNARYPLELPPATETYQPPQPVERPAPNQCLTESVPECGRRLYGLGKAASYAAAARGDIITIRIGHKLRAPIAANNRKLEQAGK